MNQDPSNPNSQPSNTIYDLDSSNGLDLDQPIALRKGVRSCTQHPINNHVSYGKLSQRRQGQRRDIFWSREEIFRGAFRESCQEGLLREGAFERSGILRD